MDEELDVTIEIRFLSNKGVPVGLVNEITRRVTWAVHSVEEEELDAMFEHFQEWTSVERDAMRYRFGKLDRDRVLILEDAKRGSLLLLAAVAGFAYWVADKTLGETVKEAWVESAGHSRLKAFLKSRVFRKRNEIVQKVSRSVSHTEGANNVEVTTDGNQGVVVKVAPNEAARIPKPSEIAAARDDDAADVEAPRPPTPHG